LRHRFWYGVSERVRWSRGAFRETPALRLPALPAEQSRRIAALKDRYQARFESELGTQTSLNNYEYLDILDYAWPSTAPAPPHGMELLCDVGCASFWYAAALDAFFRPRAMVGVDVEGYRLFKDGRTRSDYAAGYLSQRSNARFVVADYLGYTEPADLITAWFPFLTPRAILAWRLPLSLLRPERLIRQIHANLKPGGCFVMVNHGPEEAELAHRWCTAAGFRLTYRQSTPSLLSRGRPFPPVVSWWRLSREPGAPGEGANLGAATPCLQ
jgi:SAM-dependent methyltransferase